MADKKTKAMLYAEVRAIVEVSGAENVAELLEFVDAQVEQLEKKSEKAKERAAKQKQEGDELREAVYSVLTDEYQTIDAITAQIEGEDITKSKVTARLTQLIKAEMAEKALVKGEEDGKKVMRYRLIQFKDSDESAE